MKKISIQLYALPEELFKMIEKWKQEFGFQMVIMKLFPNVVISKIDSFDDLGKLPIKLEEIYCVFLGLQTPEINVHHRFDFLEKNQNFLTIDIGKLSNEGLEESWFSGRTDNLTILKLWKKLAGQLKKNTYSGIWAINTETDAKHYYKNSRYTLGACALSKSGTKLLTNGSFVYCFIDKSCYDEQ